MPTTTNLALRYPQNTDYIGQGYLNIQNLANDVDGYFGALTAYTPTFTNVTTGAGTFGYRRVGKLGFVSGSFSGGTATAAAAVQVSLPTGWTGVARRQAISAGNDTGTVGVTFGLVGVSGTTVVLYATAARANYGAGAALSTTFFAGWIELA